MMKHGMLGIMLVAWLSFLTVPAWAQVKGATPTPTKIAFPEVVAGETKTIDKTVNNDLIVAGGQLKIGTTVKGDAYVAGGEIAINGTIDGNLFVAGGQVLIDKEAKIGGYVLAAGGQITINGQTAGPVRIGAGKLVVGENANIGGNLEAIVTKVDVSEKAVIKGEKKIEVREVKSHEIPKRALVGLSIMGTVISFLGKLIVLLILVKLFGTKMEPINKWFKMFWSTMGWGLVVLAVTPMLILTLLLTIVGIPLGLIVLVLYMVITYVSNLAVSGALGSWLVEKEWLRTENKYLVAIVGLLIVTILGKIPLVGGLFNFVVLLLGLGIIFKLVTTSKN